MNYNALLLKCGPDGGCPPVREGVLRLYHHEVWDISDQDVDSLPILGENIGMAMMFTRLLNSFQGIKRAVEGLPPELNRWMWVFQKRDVATAHDVGK